MATAQGTTLVRRAGNGSAREDKFLAERLLYLAIVFVPFQQALTVNVGFPLKISEVLGILGVGLLIIEGRKPRYRATNGKNLLSIGAILLASTVFNLTRRLPVKSSFGYEYGFTFDILQYAAYALLVLIVGWFAATRVGPDRIGRAIGIAARLAFAYSAVQFVLWLAGLRHILESLNGATYMGLSYGLPLPRNGPFLEGNHLGFFAGAAFFICICRKDKVGALTAAACLLYSQSTIGLIGVIAALLAGTTLRPRWRSVGELATVAAAAFVTIAFLPAASTFVSMQLGKLGIGDAADTVAYLDISFRDRSANAEIGATMAIDNPVLGVGPGRYGVWHDELVDKIELPAKFLSKSYRPIAHNAYAQVSSELGLIAGATLVLLLLSVFLILYRAKSPDLALVIFVAVALNAVPAWTLLPIWFTIAYLIGVAAAQPWRERANLTLLASSLSKSRRKAGQE